jgi:hypothetical protein
MIVRSEDPPYIVRIQHVPLVTPDLVAMGLVVSTPNT